MAIKAGLKSTSKEDGWQCSESQATNHKRNHQLEKSRKACILPDLHVNVRNIKTIDCLQRNIAMVFLIYYSHSLPPSNSISTTMAKVFIFLMMILWAGLAFSQSRSQNSAVPNRIRACDTQEIKASKCSSEDGCCRSPSSTTVLSQTIARVPHNSTCMMSKIAHSSTTRFNILLTIASSFGIHSQRCLSELQSFCSDEHDWRYHEDSDANTL
jgi:hypothetical protein